MENSMENFRDTISVNRIGNPVDGESIRIVIRRRGPERGILYEGYMKMDEFARLLVGVGECEIETEKVSKILASQNE